MKYIDQKPRWKEHTLHRSSMITFQVMLFGLPYISNSKNRWNNKFDSSGKKNCKLLWISSIIPIGLSHIFGKLQIVVHFENKVIS